MNHEFGQDTIEALQTPDDSQVLHDSVSEISNREEYSLQNNVIITQTLLGSSNLLEAGVLNHVVQNGNAAGTTCLETSLEKQDSDQSGGSVEVDLNISGEQGSPSAYVFVSEKETELDSLEDSEEGVVSGVTNGAILSPESNASDETNVAVLREHETLPNNCHDGTIDGVVNEINLPENTNGVLHTKQTTLQDHEALSGSVSSDVAQIMDDQSRSKMDGFTSITDSSETEVRTKTVELSNEHNLQDEFEPLLVDSNHDEQENSENLVSQLTSDAKELLPTEGKHSVLQIDENDLKKPTSGITTEEVEASNFKHDEGSSTTTTISRRTSKAQQKKEENLFWLVLRAFVIAVSKLWTK
ncbi:hypothetical protein QOZ80_5AG0392460 [Eleusine coracana subsp. coracana]|nr:hypothetical protein QOZ80_5AG0392460 [Eleusine coracana subsp. coracana]